ncbi:MAG: Arc family DNA binding domain-containing protein [Bacteroidales bacterium]|nr:Arc family DNA binding domain-containing protein [Bacteroidales bacterium]
MAEKKVFALRVNEELLKAVERWAADDFRSVNGQLEWLIHKALKEARRLPDPDKPVSSESAK